MLYVDTLPDSRFNEEVSSEGEYLGGSMEGRVGRGSIQGESIQGGREYSGGGGISRVQVGDPSIDFSKLSTMPLYRNLKLFF